MLSTSSRLMAKKIFPPFAYDRSVAKKAIQDPMFECTFVIKEYPDILLGNYCRVDMNSTTASGDMDSSRNGHFVVDSEMMQAVGRTSITTHMKQSTRKWRRGVS